MSDTTDDCWGEEVMRGVRILRRGSVNPYVRFAQTAQDAASQSAPSKTEVNFTKVYEDIQQIETLISSLKYSNEYMERYLANREGPDKPSAGVAASEGGALVDQGEDEPVFEAIQENRLLIREKERELEGLLALVQMHRCSCCNHQSHDHFHSSTEGAGTAANPSGTSAQPLSDDGDDVLAVDGEPSMLAFSRLGRFSL
jgi:hypothetical protein